MAKFLKFGKFYPMMVKNTPFICELEQIINFFQSIQTTDDQSDNTHKLR